MSKKDKNKKVEEKEVTVEILEEEKQEEVELTETEKLQQTIEELQKEVTITKNAYYKAYADTENLKKRLLSDAENAHKYRIQSFAQSILPALDALEIALAGKDISDPFVKGVKLTYDQIIQALTDEGVSQIDSIDKPFDPNFENAMVTEKVEGVEPNIVIEVFQKGYMLKDRLLRAALVKVSE
ncbi:MAG: nucleotide exchange factor GrpE [Erysipelotrichaceae bacterium]|jgi:molecular chaperone GrpE